MNSGPNRRQPTRSVRTTASRPSNYYARFPGYRTVLAGAPESETANDSTPGFFPAIEHFTDAISALPKETVRHLTLLKETEGKAYQPEQAITELLAAIDQLPPPPRSQAHPQEQAYISLSLTNSVNGSVSGSVIDGILPRSSRTLTDPLDQIPASQPADEHTEARFELFKRLHANLREGAQVLDEKNTIFYAANEALSRQLSRIDNVIPHVELEISEDARVGSNTHWALPHMKELRRGTTNDRGRRDVLAANSLAAAAAAVHETDIAATRSEARREAMLAKRHRNHNVDSDFEERATSKRAHASTKVRRGQDGDVRSRNPAATNPPAKRRRVDNNGLVASHRNSTPSQSRAVAGSTADGAGSRKKTKPLTAQTSSRKRIAGNSPSLGTSPIRGTFSTIANKEQSPAPTASRNAPSKARQSSVQSTLQENSRNRPSSGHKGVNGVSTGTPELKSVAKATGQTIPEARSGLKDTYNVNHEELIEAAGVQGALAVKSTAAPSSSDMKREDTEPIEAEPGSARGGHGSALIRSRGGSRGSKPTTPIDGPTADPVASTQASRSRTTRGANNGNSAASPPHRGGTSSRRPQKKSAAAVAAAAAAAEESAWSSADDDGFGQGAADAADVVEDGGDDNDEVASNEPVYCVCKQPSYGDMIACDNRNCPTEWFHLGCVGLSRPPGSKTKWYCEDCRELMKQKKDGR